MKVFTLPILGTKLIIQGKDRSFLQFMPELRGKLMRGPLSPRLISLHGATVPRELDLGVLSYRVVTNSGVAFLATNWLDGSKSIANFNAHGHGTGVTAENATDIALGTEVGTRAAGAKTAPAANQLRTIATVAVGASLAITEQGLFDSTTVSGSTLWDRSVFAAINVQSGDSIQYTYTLTVVSGG